MQVMKWKKKAYLRLQQVGVGNSNFLPFINPLNAPYNNSWTIILAHLIYNNAHTKIH